MAGKSVTKSEIAQRQLIVARLMARKTPEAEIVTALKKAELEASDRTVRRDMKAVRDAWLEEAAEEIAGLRARELGELREMERDCALMFSKTKDPRFMSERRQIKARIAALLALDAPQRIEHSGRLELEAKSYSGFDPEDV